MTSEPSLTKLLTDLLIAHEYSDITGPLPVNPTEALLAIATSITRLAVAHERANERAERMLAYINEPPEMDDGKPGHA